MDLKCPAIQKKRGLTAILTAVSGEALFGFFLLAGFGDRGWAPAAFSLMSAAMVLLLAQGILQSQAASSCIQVTKEGLTVIKGRRRADLPWPAIDRIGFGGFINPVVTLRAGDVNARLPKAFPGYPVIWSLLRKMDCAPKAPCGPLTVRCFRTGQMGALAAGALLCLAAAVFMLPFYAAVVALFDALMLFVLWTMVKDFTIYTLEAGGLHRRGWFKETWIPASELREAVLEQVPLRHRVTAWRYRGEAMAAQVRFDEADLGLRVRIKLAQGEMTLDDTMTGYPLELLFDELCRRYKLPGRLTVAQEGEE